MQVLDLSCCPFPLTVVISLSQLGPLAFCFVPFHLDILSRNLDHLPETVLCPTSVSQRVLSVKTFACCCHLENLPRMILYLYPTSVSLSVFREKLFHIVAIALCVFVNGELGLGFLELLLSFYGF